MLVFLVTSRAESAGLEDKLVEAYPSANLKFSANTWLVADSGVTAQEVCEKINVKPNGISGVIVVRVDEYFGFASSSVWDWIRLKTGNPDG